VRVTRTSDERKLTPGVTIKSRAWRLRGHDGQDDGQAA